ncbi:MAG TPA: S8 family serine peptidase [Bacteroidales bacterium]|nr:S8 family serine peptidase [Bacteroidales bacterium]
MKHHFVARIEKEFKDKLTVHPLHWQEMLTDRSKMIDTFFPEFDALFDSYQFKFWLSKEYGRDHQGTWTDEELFIGLDCFYRIILQKDYSIPSNFINEIKKLPHIVDVRELIIGEAPIPAQISQQASIAVKKPGELIYLPYAHLLTKGTSSVTIAVLDTGVNPDHPELKGKIVRRSDFVNLEGLDTSAFISDVKQYEDWPVDVVGHGTHVSGIIAAKGLQMDEGVCPDCKILAVRVLATMKSGDKLVGAGIVDNINNGIKWAVDQGADIINMSLGIRHTGGGLPHQEVIDYALHKNVSIIAASGNDGTEEKYYPGALPGVIAVGAVDDSGNVTTFTSYGANITVVAPGLNVYSSFTNNGYAFASGTSQASPFVTGMVGLLKSYALKKGKKLGNEQIRFILKSTSDKINSRLRDQRAGYGLINLADAFKLLDYMVN